MKSSLFYTFTFLFGLLLLSIYLGFSSYIICLVILCIALFLSNKETVGIYLILYGGFVGGMTRSLYPNLPIYGLMLNLLGVLFVHKYLLALIKKDKSIISDLLIVLLIFFFFYLLSNHTAYAQSKIINIFKNGTFALIAYYVFCKSSKIRLVDLSVFLLLSSILAIIFDIHLCGLNVGSFYDFNWLRGGIELYNYQNADDDASISYQIIGMNALFALAIYLSSLNVEKVKGAVIIVLSLILILLSGARQAVLGMYLIMVARFIIFHKKQKDFLSYFVLGFTVLVLLAYLVFSLRSEMVDIIMETGGNGRNVVMLAAIRFFLSEPLTGIGFGAFADMVRIETINYPHNIILEILCELGLIGFILISLVVIIFWKNNHIILKCHTNSFSYIFLVMIALLTRYFVSADFGGSIELFSCLFATACITKKTAK